MMNKLRKMYEGTGYAKLTQLSMNSATTGEASSAVTKEVFDRATRHVVAHVHDTPPCACAFCKQVRHEPVSGEELFTAVDKIMLEKDWQ